MNIEVSLLTVVAFLASLLGHMFLVHTAFSIKKPLTPFITFSCLLLVLYIAGILSILEEISIALYFLGLISFVYAIYTIVKNGKSWFRSLVDFTKTNSVIVFFVFMFILNWFIFRVFIITKGDDFSFWAIFPRILLSYNDIVGGLNTLNKADYPRLLSLLHYYFTYFTNGAKFHEGIAVFAQVSVFLSALPAFVFYKKKPKWYLTILYSLCFYILFFVFVLPIYFLLNDSMLVLFWAMSIILYFKLGANKKSLWILCIVLFCMVQIKETGIIFAACTVFIIAMDTLFNKGREKMKWIVLAKPVLILLTVMLISKASWNTYKYYSNIGHSSFSLKPSQINLFDLKEYQKQASSNYFKSLVFIGNPNSQEIIEGRKDSKFISALGTTINLKDKVEGFNKLTNSKIEVKGWLGEFELGLSPLFWTIAGVFYFMVFYRLNGNGYFIEGRRLKVLSISILLILAGYILLMFILYLYSFKESEAITLVSYFRYLGTMFGGVFLLLFYFFIRSRKAFIPVSFCIFMFLFTPLSAFETIVPRHTMAIYPYLNNIYEKIDPVIDEIKEADMDAKVFFINQTGTGGFWRKFRYRAFPLKMWGYSFSPVKRTDWSVETTVIDNEKFYEKIREYDYLVIWNDKDLWEHYEEAIMKANFKVIWVKSGSKLVKWSPPSEPKK